MSSVLRSERAPCLVRVFAAAILLPSVSCTALKSRPVRASGTTRVDAALQSVNDTWRQLPVAAAASASATTQWRVSLGGLLQALESYSSPRTWTGTQSIGGWNVTFAGDSSARKSIPPSWCEHITPVDPLNGLRAAAGLTQSDGAGLPVVMLQKKAAPTADPFFPPHGRFLPATLTADFAGERNVTLTFNNTRNVESAHVRGALRPLASDVPEAIGSGMHKRFLGKFAFRGLLWPDHDLNAAGIYTPEPFDSSKIPVVFVHGIESSPHIWANAMKAIADDPLLRGRFQAWYFLYPTGLSMHAAAAMLRESLQKTRDFYDPQHRYPAMRQMVVVGHSMGGLLAQMQVIDSGDDLYHAFFTVPLDQIPLSKANRDLVRKTLEFRHLPFVKRVVFVATPHRGSDVAELSVIRFVSRLIRPAKLISGLFREMSSIAHFAVNPKLRRFRDLGSRTTEGLSPNHPLLAAMNQRPLLVPFHSIIATWKPLSIGKTVEQSTDGVVPYSSAWLDGAESTAVVPSFHTCAEKPAVSRELVRILHRHDGVR